eukprot:CAMPEP_0185604458 /NCGR_PEP_ID=MMETSP0436-20130131/3311_1 /TAXON_ID=626734 ORGANISM="Favella taraikaensis, Strain Fe Narragansett Bay" /NCGR_SAMPLE_ID=MMETSP0436 /ASSEMBLY_ACC=CAM_ASM_000390 /LENGTH=47 /DNA_ID= /DNA_START= /DNA_END= /DNA_ORIENTATION=
MAQTVKQLVLKRRPEDAISAFSCACRVATLDDEATDVLVKLRAHVVV